MPRVSIKYSRHFLKQYYKLSLKTQKQFQNRLLLWLSDPHNPQLHLHVLVGQYSGMYSINITGDVRALYQKINDSYVIFGFIGTHSQLYN